jgi:hypothetical protein
LEVDCRRKSRRELLGNPDTGLSDVAVFVRLIEIGDTLEALLEQVGRFHDTHVFDIVDDAVDPVGITGA